MLTLSSESQDSLADRFDEQGIERQTLGLSRFEGLFLAETRVRAAIANIKPDVIHTSGIRGDFVGYAVSGDIAHVMTIRNYAWSDYPPRYGKITGGLMAWLHTNLVKRGECPIACSKSVASYLSSLRPDIGAVPNGVDTTKFRPADARERLGLRHTLGLDASRPVIISVGWLMYRKWPEVLLDAYVEGDVHRYADLLFLGDGPLRQALAQRADGIPTVKFTGRVGNVVDYLRCADVFVSTSRAEGLPNSVLEALACGLPVVLSDIEPHLEFGVEAADAGAIAKLGDARDFSRKILEVLNGPLVDQSENARKLAVNRFSAICMSERYAKAYARLLQ